MHIEEMDMEVEWNEEMERIWFYQTKVGEIGIGEKFGAIVRVTFGRDMGGLPEEFDMTETPLLKLAAVEFRNIWMGNGKHSICLWHRKEPLSRNRYGRNSEKSLMGRQLPMGKSLPLWASPKGQEPSDVPTMKIPLPSSFPAIVW